MRASLSCSNDADELAQEAAVCHQLDLFQAWPHEVSREEGLQDRGSVLRSYFEFQPALIVPYLLDGFKTVSARAGVIVRVYDAKGERR